MLPCSEVTRLYATDEIRRASLARRLAVRFHLLVCVHCRRYVRELRLIGAAVRDEIRRLTSDPSEVRRLEATVLEQVRSEVHQAEQGPPG